MADEKPEKPASLVALEGRIAESIERGYRHGDVNHLLQPIIGVLRLRKHHDKPVTDEDVEWAIEAMNQACMAENALLAYLHPQRYGLEGR